MFSRTIVNLSQLTYYFTVNLQKYYLNYRVKSIKNKKKAGVDPITRAFEQMKVTHHSMFLHLLCLSIFTEQIQRFMVCLQRVKNPPIPLKNFASIESMREEINEVVAFLQNPRAFQEMGARAPRVCFVIPNRLYKYSNISFI